MNKFFAFLLSIVIFFAVTLGSAYLLTVIDSSSLPPKLHDAIEYLAGLLIGEMDAEVMSNEGCGLPEEEDGVYDVDFTKATFKDVTDLSFYLDGCPTEGKSSLLVIPVDFSDKTAKSQGYEIDTIVKAFVGTSEEVDYYSVKDYYYISSYGSLDLDVTVLDTWFRPSEDSEYYSDYYEINVDGNEITGEQLILDEALEMLEESMDLSKFDSDKNGTIDSVVLVSSVDVNPNNIFEWAFRYWNYYTDSNGDYYTYDGVYANDYIWASYLFLTEKRDELGVGSYGHPDVLNTYTYIHEFGHILGAEDYYDTAYVISPLNGFDVMDAKPGDHNPFTKFYYGWIENSRLVVCEDSITLTLESFGESGDTILLANNWNDELGLFQEYFIVSYYRNTGLNAGEYGYFAEEGIVVYHVNATLAKTELLGEEIYFTYNSNTFLQGSIDNILELVMMPDGSHVLGVGESLHSVKDDNEDELGYTFKVDSINGGTATLTFTKK